MMLPWRKWLILLPSHIVSFEVEGVIGIFWSRAISGSSEFPPHDSFFEFILMAGEHIFDGALIFFFFFDVLIIYFIKILSAAGIGFVC